MGIRHHEDYCDASWNVVLGCTPVSPGCDSCLAANSVYRFSRHPDQRIALPMAGLTIPGSRGTWTGAVRCFQTKLREPDKWVVSRRVAVAPLGDLFHQSVPDEFILSVFRTMLRNPRHTFVVMTRRVERMAEFSRRLCLNERLNALYLATVGGRPYLPLAPHIWMGTSVENQEWADKRIPVLLQVDCRVRFLSVEPMLGPVDLRHVRHDGLVTDALTGSWTSDGGQVRQGCHRSRIGWAIIGGESGPKARLCDMDWMRSIRNQCKAAGVSLWVKQAGTRPCNGSILLPYTGKPRATLDELPVDLRIRDFPKVK